MEGKRIRSVGFKREAVTPGPAVPSAEKVDFIRKGKKKKTITKYQQNKNITYRNQGDQIIVTEKEKKFDETGVARKKRNYVMYESKLGTEKERDMTKIAAKKMRKPQPRVEERIVMKRKRKEYLDNYQYHETKVIKEPRNASYVFHQRLGGPVGGIYETQTYERQIIRTNDGNSATLRASSTGTRNRPTRNVPSNLTYNRHLKTQTGLLSNNTGVRYKRPITKAVTNETTFKKITRNTNLRTDTDNPKTQRERETKLSNILNDTDNTLIQKEIEKIEKIENTKSLKDPDTNENGDVKETVNITIQKETATDSAKPQRENFLTEYRKYLKRTITTDPHGNTTTTTKTTIERGGKGDRKGRF